MWVINVDKHSRIILSFNEIITEANYDFVEVFDGNSVRSQSLGKFSGSSEPANLISSSNSLTVYFTTDGSTVFEGFSARYSKNLPIYA
jgi:hypothetical protein